MGIFLAIFIAIQSVSRNGPTQSLTTVSVCDVLADDPTKLNGNVIRVRGLLSPTGEGTWLSGECKTHIVTKGLSWGNDLAMETDASDENAARSMERMRQKLKLLHPDYARDRVWVTIIGRLETRASMDDEVVQMPYGLHRAGFGHMSGSPAAINVMSIEEVTVERRPREKTR